MERVRGVILRRHRPVDAPVDVASAVRVARRHAVELHAVDVAAAGLADLGKPQGYALRQVRGWTERWNAAAPGRCRRSKAPRAG